MLFLSKKDKKATAVIFDIGSGSVGAALVLFEKDEKPTILYNTRLPIPFQKKLHSNLFIKNMLNTLQRVAENVINKGITNINHKTDKKQIRKIDSVMCVFSSPWYESQTEIINFDRKKPFTVSSRTIGKAIKRADKYFKKSHSKKHGDEEDGNVILIEKNIIQTKLNGYPTDNPYGKKARHVELALLLSKVSSRVHNSIKEVIGKIIHTENILFHSFALVSFSTIRDIFHMEDDFINIDIGGEMTEISLIRNNVLLETITFPFGKNFLTRHVSLKLNTLPEEAHSLVNMHFDKKINDSSDIKNVLDEVRQKWMSSFKKALSNISEGTILPKTIFLTADSYIGEWFKEAIREDDFSRYTLAGEPFMVVIVNEKHLYQHYHMAESIEHDPFLALEAMFFNKIAHR